MWCWAAAPAKEEKGEKGIDAQKVSAKRKKKIEEKKEEKRKSRAKIPPRIRIGLGTMDLVRLAKGRRPIKRTGYQGAVPSVELGTQPNGKIAANEKGKKVRQ